MESEGFTFGTEQYLRWQQLLEKLPADLSLAELKTIVVPLLVANETEQTLVYEIYENCLAEVEALQATEVENTSKKHWWKRLLPLALLALVLIIGYQYCFSDTEANTVLADEIEPSYLQLRPNETKTVCIKRNKLGKRPQMVQTSVQNTAEIDAHLGTYQLDSICLTYTANDTIGADTFQVQLTDINGKNWQTTFFVTIRSVPLDTIMRQVLQKKARPVSTPLFAAKELPYSNDIRDLTIPPLNALEKFYQENAKLIKFLLIALFTALLVKILLIRDEKRKKLIAETNTDVAVSPILSLPKAALETLKSSEVFYRLLNKFRGRTPDDFYRLHIPKTIDHTIKNAGMVRFQYELPKRPSEFLLLIDRAKDGHHLGALFDLVHEYFKENEVHFERFFWDAKNGLAYNENFPKGLRADALQHQFYQSKLLFLTADNTIAANFKHFNRNWTSHFKNWADAVVVLPVAVYGQLSETSKKRAKFALIPATLEGLEVILEPEAQGNIRIRKSKSALFSEAIAKNDTAVVVALQQQFSKPLQSWIAATALYPSLHWNLTLHLGEMVADYYDEPSLLSIENLVDIANLSWFVQGEMPMEIRTALIDFLKVKQPALYEKVNATVDAIFKKKEALAVQEALVHDTAIIGLENGGATAESVHEPKAEPYKNRLDKKAKVPVVKKLTRQQTKLDYIIPSEWRQFLKKAGFPNLGMQDFWKDVLFLMLPLWLLFSGFVWNLPETWDNCEGEIIRYEHEGELLDLCIDSPQDRILLYEYQARAAIKTENARKVDSLANLVQKGRDKGIFDAVLAKGKPDVEPLRQAEKSFFANVGTSYYNRGVQLYEESQTSEEDAETRAESRDKVCYHFDRAIVFDSLSLDLQKAVRWCLKNQIKSVRLQGQLINASTRQPIPNAKVRYLGQTTATNQSGRFAFSINKKSIAAKRAQLNINKADYLPRLDSFSIQQLDRETYAIPTPIELLPKPTQAVKYRLRGTLADEATEKSIATPINIYINGQLEAVGEQGQFDFEITNEIVKNDQVTIKFASVDYEALTQVLNFNNHKDISLKVTLKALPQEIAGVAEAPKVDASAGVGEAVDSLDYLLTTIMETREAFTPFNFETPIPKMELIEGDTFRMGDVLQDGENVNEQVHSVALSSFYLGTYEVTFEEFDRFTRATKLPLLDTKGWGRGAQPAVGASWYQAIEYCNWLSAEHGYEPVYTIDKTLLDEANLDDSDTLKWTITANWKASGYRLPTEAEWEFAARQGGQSLRFGNGLNQANPEVINFAGQANPTKTYEIAGIDRQQPLAVGSLTANANGLYDMSGNVKEWCWDWLGDYTTTTLETDPKGIEKGTQKVVRGGSFDLSAAAVRNTARLGNAPQTKTLIGFRLCRGTQ